MRFKYIFLLSLVSMSIFPVKAVASEVSGSRFWQIQSIDTMVSSRDLARDKVKDLTFDSVISKQVSQIAATGATHIAIDTPYDAEFLPYLIRWVDHARKNNLSVWFRGNWSGWEEWFNYPRISRDQHLQKTRDFILHNPNLFADGDIFSSCPECENGGPGDPRVTGDIIGFRKFLIDLYTTCNQSFTEINKTVNCGIQGSNGDVTKLIYDKPTAAALGGIVSVDHYVRVPQVLIADLSAIAKSSGAKIMLGEFGAPILSIHGQMSQSQQVDWVNEVLSRASINPEIIGVNYWSNLGSSTAIWSTDVNPYPAVETLKKYYQPQQLKLNIRNEVNEYISGVTITYLGRNYHANTPGQTALPRVESNQVVNIAASGYQEQGAEITSKTDSLDITMVKNNIDLFFLLRKLLFDLSRSILS